MTERRLEIIQLQETLKEIMHARHLRLGDLAIHLDVSIATAKRLLNGDDLSLERVLAICEWMDLKFHELVEIAKLRRAEYHYCSEEQEDYLAANRPQFAFLRALQRGDTLEAISKRHALKQKDVDGYLMDLEVHGFMRRQDDGTLKLVIKDGMDWRPNGALWKAYYRRWVDEVTSHMITRPVDDPKVAVELSQRKFTKETMTLLRRELDDLSRKYAAISRMERQVHPPEKLEFYTLICLGDEWMAPLFDVPPYVRGELKKETPKK